jgi:hypothetical protein
MATPFQSADCPLLLLLLLLPTAAARSPARTTAAQHAKAALAKAHMYADVATSRPPSHRSVQLPAQTPPTTPPPSKSDAMDADADAPMPTWWQRARAERARRAN